MCIRDRPGAELAVLIVMFCVHFVHKRAHHRVVHGVPDVPDKKQRRQDGGIDPVSYTHLVSSSAPGTAIRPRSARRSSALKNSFALVLACTMEMCIRDRFWGPVGVLEFENATITYTREKPVFRGVMADGSAFDYSDVDPGADMHNL